MIDENINARASVDGGCLSEPLYERQMFWYDRAAKDWSILTWMGRKKDINYCYFKQVGFPKSILGTI